MIARHAILPENSLSWYSPDAVEFERTTRIGLRWIQRKAEFVLPLFRGDQYVDGEEIPTRNRTLIRIEAQVQVIPVEPEQDRRENAFGFPHGA